MRLSTPQPTQPSPREFQKLEMRHCNIIYSLMLARNTCQEIPNTPLTPVFIVFEESHSFPYSLEVFQHGKLHLLQKNIPAFHLELFLKPSSLVS
jgi:hypothetical protein